MRFDPPLTGGVLVQRYKRFLADILLDDGTDLTAHCPNPGAMLGLNMPGMRVWLSKSENAARKLPYTLELCEVRSGDKCVTVGVNTMAPNRLVAEALAAGAISELSGYASVRREVKYGEASRIDFLLESPDRPPCWLEIKNCHLMRQPGLAEFPDCVAARSAKHLRELEAMKAKGDRAVMLFVVQRSDCDHFDTAGDIDPTYAKGLIRAAEAGVEVLVYRCDLSVQGVTITTSMPWLR